MAQDELTGAEPMDTQVRPRKADDRNARSRRPAGTYLNSTVPNRPFNSIYFPRYRFSAAATESLAVSFWSYSGPILTPKNVLPIFLDVGFLLIPIGEFLIWANFLIRDIVIYYSDCWKAAPLNSSVAIPDNVQTTSMSKTRQELHWQRKHD
ncbi:hypothetical protein N7522_002706 [Penicillium canescens]|nr:hypothetical protein N7522_002706 [Penicillium canescens]